MSDAGVNQVDAGTPGPAVLPTLLTLVRVLLAPALAAATLGGHPLITSALVVLAAGTDLADGRVARLLGQVSARGAVLDAVADAAVLGALTISLVARSAAPVALACVVVAREVVWVVLIARDARNGPDAATRSPHAGLGGALLLAGATTLAVATAGAAPVLRPIAWALIGWGLALAWLVVALRPDDALVVGTRPAPRPDRRTLQPAQPPTDRPEPASCPDPRPDEEVTP